MNFTSCKGKEWWVNRPNHLNYPYVWKTHVSYLGCHKNNSFLQSIQYQWTLSPSSKYLLPLNKTAQFLLSICSTLPIQFWISPQSYQLTNDFWFLMKIDLISTLMKIPVPFQIPSPWQKMPWLLYLACLTHSKYTKILGQYNIWFQKSF